MIEIVKCVNFTNHFDILMTGIVILRDKEMRNIDKDIFFYVYYHYPYLNLINFTRYLLHVFCVL